jgi:hypothetical protein
MYQFFEQKKTYDISLDQTIGDDTPYSSQHSRWYPSTYTLDAYSFKRALAGEPIYMNHLDCVLAYWGLPHILDIIWKRRH